MLTIICGEDTVKSREYFTSLKNIYKQKNYQIQDISPSQIQEIQLWIGESQSLFFNKHVFFTENVESKVTRSKTKKVIKTNSHSSKSFEDILTELAHNNNIELIDWEESKQGREIKLKNMATVKEFKLSTSVFKLQDACFPGNLKNFLRILSDVTSFQDEQFIFIMLARYTRSLILARDNIFAKTVQSWQQYKLKKIAFMWSLPQLLGWYDGLFRIDLTMKTASNPYGLTKSLEILACHYL